MSTKEEIIELTKALAISDRLSCSKKSLSSALHEEIHVLHNISDMLLDDDLSNDKSTLDILKRTITRIGTLLSMRECLETI